MEPTISIHQLEKSQDAALLAAQSKPMRQLRLKSLLEDPESFISTYKDEVDQPDEFWINRLRPETAHHFVAIKDYKEGAPLPEQCWVAFLVVVASETQHPKAIPPDYHNKNLYFLNALWVDPALRGQGVGRRVVEFAAAWSKEESRLNGLHQSILELEVVASNVSAMQFYNRLGFTAVEEKEGRPKEGVPVKLVRMQYDTFRG